MGLFSRKPKEDLEALFKQKYKHINTLSTQAYNELDFVIKESLYQLIVEEYDELLALIDRGAPFNKEQFINLKNDAMHHLETTHNINKE